MLLQAQQQSLFCIELVFLLMLPKSSIAQLKSAHAAARMKAEKKKEKLRLANPLLPEVLPERKRVRERKLTFCRDCIFKIQIRIFFSNSQA